MPLTGLRASLLIQPSVASRPEDFVTVGLLMNTSAETAAIELESLSSPSLALQLRAVGGETLPLPPPPVPSADHPRAQLAPGASLEIRFAGFLPSWAEPGSYAARLRYATDEGELYSDWASFELT